MIGFLLILAGAVAFYNSVYTHWDYARKLVCKSVLFYIGLGITVLTFFATISFMGTVVEDVQDAQLISRLGFIERAAEDNDYAWLPVYMESDKDYEEEFECYWERMIMHECAMQYRIYAAAKESGMGREYEQKADEWELLMKQYCANPAYAINQPYGKYFMELAGGK